MPVVSSTGPVPPIPFRVSPLIRVSRWSLLLLGIAYGWIHDKGLRRKEAKLKIKNEQLRAIMEPIRKEEQKRLAQAELQDLAKQLGVDGKF